VSQLNRDWKVQPHGPVERLEEGLATVAGEIIMPLGRFPRRMTVVSLSEGRSAVWSAIPLEETAMAEIEALGSPAFLVVPGIGHRLDVAAWKARYPKAKVLCPKGAAPMVAEAVPVDFTDDPFDDPEVHFEIVPGAGGKEGALTVTRQGRLTLVLNDILAHVRRPRGIGAKIMARLFGFGVKEPQMPRNVRRMFVEDELAIGQAFRRWALMSNLTRVVVSHGDVIEEAPRKVLARMATEFGA